MRKLVTALRLALAVLCGLPIEPAKAADAEVRYVITNGGVDVRGHGQVVYFPPGKHDAAPVTWGGSGAPLRMAAGTYDVHVTFSDGAAKKEIWLDNQTFAAGTAEKTVEIGMPIAEVHYIITNDGIDVHGHGEAEYYANGDHDGPKVTWASSGDTVRLAAGTYSVHISFDDGDAHKKVWLDNQTFFGTVEKTVKVHRSRMMRKMQVRTVAALAHMVEILIAADDRMS